MAAILANCASTANRIADFKHHYNRCCGKHRRPRQLERVLYDLGPVVEYLLHAICVGHQVKKTVTFGNTKGADEKMCRADTSAVSPRSSWLMRRWWRQSLRAVPNVVSIGVVFRSGVQRAIIPGSWRKTLTSKVIVCCQDSGQDGVHLPIKEVRKCRFRQPQTGLKLRPPSSWGLGF